MGSRKKTIEEIRDICSKLNLTLLSDTYNHNKDKLTVITKDNYKIYANIHDLKNAINREKQPFLNTNPYVLENIKQWLINNNKPFKLKEGQAYNFAHEKIIWICPIHDEFDGTWSKIREGQGCNLCNGKKVVLSNSMYSVRPDLVKYFVNKDDAKNVKPNGTKTVNLKCVNCKFEKSITANELYIKGFNCPFCSKINSMSYGERVCYRLLKNLNIEFEREYSEKWSNGKRYDFYIQSLNMIIEIHGEQHYTNKFNVVGSRTLQEEKENDKLKYNLAIQNGIKPENYIVIDCRNSTVSWAVHNFKQSLNGKINYNERTMKKSINEAQKNIVEESWEMWNSGKFKNTLELANALNFSRETVTKWLKTGFELGMCSYDKNLEVKRNAERFSNAERLNKKQIIQLSNDGEFIKEYSSIRDAYKETGIAFQSIGKCANGKLPHAGGFLWVHKEDM